MGGFNIPNFTVGGGSAFTGQLLQLLQMLSGERQFRAGLQSDLLSNLLNVSLEANRSPINLVDRLMLSGEVGSVMPLSQASQEQYGRYTSRPQNDMLQDAIRRLDLYTIGALTPEQQVSEGYDPNTGIPLTPKQRDYLNTFNPERPLARGGTMRVDPNAVRSTRNTIAAPARVIDRTGQSVALMGEAGGETMNVNPDMGEAPGQRVDPPLPELRRDEQFRFEEIQRVAPHLSQEQMLNIARFPGGFEQYTGIQTDPRAAGARLLGGSLAADQRFRDPFVRSLALGRAPSPADLSAFEFASLPPDTQESLLSVVGPDVARQWLFELGSFSPRGTRTRIAGPVAA